MVRIRLTQIDGALPNLALMKLAHWHKQQGHEVVQTRQIEPDLFEDHYDVVYGSAIFKFSADRIERFRRAWPGAVLGGTGTGFTHTVEDFVGSEHHGYDYSGYPDFDASIGFTQRGCRLKCKFCVVPAKEGKNRSVATIEEIWRGAPYPKHLHLLDNDFFGQEPAKWAKRCQEMITGGFKVCISQGINVRLINPAACVALRMLDYRNTDFSRKQLYTAWDNLGDERIFFKGVDMLEQYGIPPQHLMAYMLVGYDPRETWDRIWYRFTLMVERGISPYPMVFGQGRADLKCFQRWVIAGGGMYRYISWGDYERETKSDESVRAWEPYAGRLTPAIVKSHGKLSTTRQRRS